MQLLNYVDNEPVSCNFSGTKNPGDEDMVPALAGFRDSGDLHMTLLRHGFPSNKTSRSPLENVSIIDASL